VPTIAGGEDEGQVALVSWDEVKRRLGTPSACRDPGSCLPAAAPLLGVEEVEVVGGQLPGGGDPQQPAHRLGVEGVGVEGA
jgi:hypothetical protein